MRAEAIHRIQRKLDVAEAFNHAYVGSQYDKRSRTSRGYARWQRKNESQIAKLEERKVYTIWDGMRHRSRKF